MTVRESIKQSMEPFVTEKIELEGGTVAGGKEMIPLLFPYFLLSAAAIFTSVIFIDNKDCDLFHASQILAGYSLLESTKMKVDVHGFIQKLLDEEVEYEDGIPTWDTFEWLVKKWNEFAFENNERVAKEK